MKISARNQFEGIVSHVKEGVVNGIVTIKSQDETITATISMDAIRELGLTEGAHAVAIVKATEVMMGLGALKLSARNQFVGTIEKINRGAVNAIVTLSLKDGVKISSTISLAAVEELGLAEGMEATAVIKATSVMIGA